MWTASARAHMSFAELRTGSALRAMLRFVKAVASVLELLLPSRCAGCGRLDERRVPAPRPVPAVRIGDSTVGAGELGHHDSWLARRRPRICCRRVRRRDPCCVARLQRARPVVPAPRVGRKSRRQRVRGRRSRLLLVASRPCPFSRRHATRSAVMIRSARWLRRPAGYLRATGLQVEVRAVLRQGRKVV